VGLYNRVGHLGYGSIGAVVVKLASCRSNEISIHGTVRHNKGPDLEMTSLVRSANTLYVVYFRLYGVVIHFYGGEIYGVVVAALTVSSSLMFDCDSRASK
jgi:hypothetical protein